MFDGPFSHPDWRVSHAAAESVAFIKQENHRTAENAAIAVSRLAPKDKRCERKAEEQLAQCSMIRDIFGNPFRHIHILSTWLSWNDSIVRRLAQAASDNRTLPAGTLDNTRLAILADAWEEAGCRDEQILTHLRSGGEHYRGCFVIDALLGKN
jgi:hypothetical protein